jgi:hypothetical protein
MSGRARTTRSQTAAAAAEALDAAGAPAESAKPLKTKPALGVSSTTMMPSASKKPVPNSAPTKPSKKPAVAASTARAENPPPKARAGASSHSSPEGTVLGDYKVGREIGKGSQAVVHELLPTSSCKDGGRWVVKLAPVPPPKAPSTYKKKQTEVERNYGTLNMEYMHYMNRFVRQQGVDVPRVKSRFEKNGTSVSELFLLFLLV